MSDDMHADGLHDEERDLLARITVQVERCLNMEHRLSRRRKVLGAAATQLRLGKPASVVLAEVQSAIPEAVLTIQDRL